MPRNRSIGIYLKPGIEEDDQIYEVWQSLTLRGRPQEVFRRLILLGLRAAVEKGELPLAAMQVLDTNILAPGPEQSFFRKNQTKEEVIIKKRGRPAGSAIKKDNHNHQKVEFNIQDVHNEFNGPFSRILGENVDEQGIGQNPKQVKEEPKAEKPPEKQKPKLGRLM